MVKLYFLKNIFSEFYDQMHGENSLTNNLPKIYIFLKIYGQMLVYNLEVKIDKIERLLILMILN